MPERPAQPEQASENPWANLTSMFAPIDRRAQKWRLLRGRTLDRHKDLVIIGALSDYCVLWWSWRTYPWLRKSDWLFKLRVKGLMSPRPLTVRRSEFLLSWTTTT